MDVPGRKPIPTRCVRATPDELKMVKDAGATISIATTPDLRVGFGLPPVSDFLAAGIPCGISVDTSALIGSSSLFGVMRNVRDAENARTLNEFKLTARHVLELATIEGARSLGIDDRVGSLRPGKRADIIAVTTRALNMGGFVDAAHLLHTRKAERFQDGAKSGGIGTTRHAGPNRASQTPPRGTKGWQLQRRLRP